MAFLRTANDDNQFLCFFEDALGGIEVPVVEGLETTDEERTLEQGAHLTLIS